MARVFRSVCIASIVSAPLVRGAHIAAEHLAAASDETTLLQAAASAKSSAAAVEDAEEAKIASCFGFAGACSESEMSFDLFVDEDLEPSGAPAVGDAAAPSAEPDALLVSLVRKTLWLLSVVVAFNGATRWRWQEPPSVAACQEIAEDTCQETIRAFSKAALAGNEGHSGACLGQSAIHKAALAGNDAGCEYLLHRTPDVLATVDAWGTTALHAAAAGGSPLVVELFLEHGAPVDATDSWDETPLHVAARAGHVEVCKLLVRSGASLCAANADGHTPLILAGFEEQYEVCRALLALGAGVDGPSDEELPGALREILAM